MPFRAYLRSVLGHDAACRTRARQRQRTRLNLEHLENRLVPTAPTFTEFTSGVTGREPWDITSGPDGNLWFTVPGTDKIAQITTAGVITQFSAGGGGETFGITSGPDGNLWFANPDGDIGRSTPTGSITNFPITPHSTNDQAFEITAGPDGNLWFVGAQRGTNLASPTEIGTITPTGIVTLYLPAALPESNGEGDITAGPDGNMWFTVPGATLIGQITPSGTVTTFTNGLSAKAEPLSITAGPDGNLWFTEAASKIGRITPAGVITEFTLPTGSAPVAITTGPDGNLWFTDEFQNEIGRITPSGTVTEFSFTALAQGAGAADHAIVTGPDGNLWFITSHFPSGTESGIWRLSNFTGQAPDITSANATTFTTTTADSFSVTATGSPAPTLSESGVLPTGVGFDPTTGLLSGTPAAGTDGVYDVTFSATNGVAPDANQQFVLTVDTAPEITSAPATTFALGAANSFTVTDSGSPDPTLTENGTLPSGVRFDPNSGLLSGTPAAGTGGIYDLTFIATNGVDPEATQDFTLTVNQAPRITSATATTFTVSTAASFNVADSGSPSPTLTETGALPTGVSFDANTGLLSGTPAAGTAGIYDLTFAATNGVAPNASQSFTLTIGQPPAITSVNATLFTVASAGTFQVTTTGFPTVTLSETGALPGGITFNPTTALVSGTPAAGSAGTYRIVFTAHNGVGSDATQTFILTVDQPPAITSANSTSFTVARAGSFQLTATGFPAVTLGESGKLPGGVTFNPVTGLLGGAPAAGTAGQYPLVFTAHNGVGSDATQTFTFTVASTGPIGSLPPPNTSSDDTWLKQVYMDLFHRTVDSSGLMTWTDYLNAGTSRTVVSALIMTSYPAYEYNHDLVESLYHRYLHRDADTGGLAFGMAELNAGVTAEQLAQALATSTEYLTATNGTNNASFVTGLFENALGRSVDAPALAAFDQVLALGATKAQVIATVLNSQEYRTEVIDGYYSALLHRPADQAGLANWLSLLQRGGTDQQVEANILGSDEYFALAQ